MVTTHMGLSTTTIVTRLFHHRLGNVLVRMVLGHETQLEGLSFHSGNEQFDYALKLDKDFLERCL